MRSFIAIPLPDEARNLISTMITDLKNSGGAARWVRNENMHITIKFLGNIDPVHVTPLADAIHQAALKFKALRVAFTAPEVFPAGRKPRIICIKPNEEDALAQIASFIDDQIKPLGFIREKKFMSHVTLARLREYVVRKPVIQKQDLSLSGKAFTLEKICLYKSTLTPHGSVYDEIFAADFRKE